MARGGTDSGLRNVLRMLHQGFWADSIIGKSDPVLPNQPQVPLPECHDAESLSSPCSGTEQIVGAVSQKEEKHKENERD